MKQRRKPSDEPVFEKETRGGWDEWSDRRQVITAVVLPDGTRLDPFDDVRIENDGRTFTAQIDFVSTDLSDVVLENVIEDFRVELDEPEFREAWGDWLRTP